MKASKTLIINMFFLIAMGFFIYPTHVSAEYQYEGMGFYTEISKKIGNTPIYRFYNSTNGDHFYTASLKERDHIIARPEWKYRYEGIVFYAYDSPNKTTAPLYRFYASTTGDHFYTTSLTERNLLIAHPEWGHAYEGVGFYVPATSTESNKRAYRFYNPTSGDHFYTISEIEKATLINDRLGPDISVGLWNVSKSESQDDPFTIRADKNYSIYDKKGALIANIKANTTTKVSYRSNHQLRIFNSITETDLHEKVVFRATDSNDTNILFHISRPNSSFDEYRGSVAVRYSGTSNSLWMINTLPLEQYIWGIGEITGTGDMDYNRTMVTAFRTYGFWKILYSTKYASEGFTVDATSGNQLYYGYEWEESYPRIRQAAESTIGRIAKHEGDVALTPYSSWTDGRTRSFEERWGSTLYPWCRSVRDPYGKHATLNTSELEAAGNHMVGISAHGALSLATDHGWDWDKILSYYLTDISLPLAY